MTMYFAVYAMRRSDLSEWIVSLVSTEALARVVGWRTLEGHAVARQVPRQADVSDQPTGARRRPRVGWMDAARGRPISDAQALPEPHRNGYLDGHVEMTG